MTSEQILKKYLSFFQKRHHQLIPNLSLIPEGDSTLLFVNSGMFPLVPYLAGEQHPLGKRLTNIQRSMRFEDLEEIGDNRHTTVFHMLGNWSLGDYFKQEQLFWVYEFFIDELRLDPKRLFASVFQGDKTVPKDTDSITIIQQIFKKYGLSAHENERIFTYGKQENWWQRGEAVGELGGPDSEIFYYIGKGSGIGKNPAQYQSEFMEIGNSVFMQYRLSESGWLELPQKNVDFGGGLERIAMVAQQKQDIFQTDNFFPIIQRLEQLSKQAYYQSPEITRSMRILADHLRASTLLAMDGVLPSNKDQGYALRRFLRRMVRFGKNKLQLENISEGLFDSVIDSIGWLYPELSTRKHEIIHLFSQEEKRFADMLLQAKKQVKQALNKATDQPRELSSLAFNLYQSTGYPPEMFIDDLQEKGSRLSMKEFEKAYQNHLAKHQQLSRAGAEKKFKGGLAGHSQQVIKYHTATHLLHQVLRTVLGQSVEQYGSNITGDRLRFDFSYSSSLSATEIKQVETVFRDLISQKLAVNFMIMEKSAAEKAGALHFFNKEYPDRVKVYYIGPNLETAISKEFCGGPHIKNLSELEPLTIYKQESVGKGVRRIYAKFV